MIRNLYHFHDPLIRGQPRQVHPCFFQDAPVIVIDLIAVSVSLGDLPLSIKGKAPGIFIQYTRICPKPQSAPDISTSF